MSAPATGRSQGITLKYSASYHVLHWPRSQAPVRGPAGNEAIISLYNDALPIPSVGVRNLH